MTSVDEGLACGQRGSPDHGLPSLVSRVSNQTAPNHPENGDDERTLDRMGTKRWTDVCREMWGSNDSRGSFWKGQAPSWGVGGSSAAVQSPLSPGFLLECECFACVWPCLAAPPPASLSCVCVIMLHRPLSSVRSPLICTPVAPLIIRLSLPASVTGGSLTFQHLSDGNGINWNSW